MSHIVAITKRDGNHVSQAINPVNVTNTYTTFFVWWEQFQIRSSAKHVFVMIEVKSTNNQEMALT